MSIDVVKFHSLRKGFGQEKYGVGEANKGYRRDNGRDVLEELSDAVVIAGYWIERLRRTDTPANIDLARRVEDLSVHLSKLMHEVSGLRDQTPVELKTETEENSGKRIPPATEVE